MLSIGYL